MVTPAFSLTQDVIIDPVLRWSGATLEARESGPTTLEYVACFLQAELATRVTALFCTSLFALIDVGIHFGSGVCKALCLAGRVLVNYTCLSYFITLAALTWEPGEILTHGWNMGLFFGIALIGWLAGFVWPGLFQYFPHTEAPLSPDVEEHIPEVLVRLSQAVSRNQEVAPFINLKEFLRTASLEDLHSFVKIFSKEYAPFKAVRQSVEHLLFRRIGQADALEPPSPLARLIKSKRLPLWYSPQEVAVACEEGSCRVNAYTQAFYFYGTSQDGLESILKAKKLDDFVATHPSLNFGPCFLGFRKTIERMSRLWQGFARITKHETTYWAHFSRPIPVTSETLAYVILNSNKEVDRLELEALCRQWTGKKITVVLLGDISRMIRKVDELKMGIPKEWQDESQEEGEVIFRGIQRAAIRERVSS